jgi:hypothetical protein
MVALLSMQDCQASRSSWSPCICSNLHMQHATCIMYSVQAVYPTHLRMRWQHTQQQRKLTCHAGQPWAAHLCRALALLIVQKLYTFCSARKISTPGCITTMPQLHPQGLFMVVSQPGYIGSGLKGSICDGSMGHSMVDLAMAVKIQLGAYWQ